MKQLTILFSLVLLFTIQSCSVSNVNSLSKCDKLKFMQLPTNDYCEVVYTDTIRNNNSKTKNISDCSIWVGRNYRSATDVIKTREDDKSLDYLTMIVKGQTTMRWNFSSMFAPTIINVSYTTEFQCKDNMIIVYRYNYNVDYYVEGSQYSRGSHVNESLPQWLSWRSNNKIKFIETDFKPYISNELLSMKRSLK